MIITLELLRNNLCLPGPRLNRRVSSVAAVRSSRTMILSGCNGLEIGQLAGLSRCGKVSPPHLDNAPPLLQDNLSSCNEKTRHCSNCSSFYSNIQASYVGLPLAGLTGGFGGAGRTQKSLSANIARRERRHAGASGSQQWRGKKKLAILIDVCAGWKHNTARVPVFDGYLLFSFYKECMHGSCS